LLARIGRVAPDGLLDRIELGNAPQRLRRNGRAGRLVDLVELAPRMGPARGQLDTAGAEPLEPGITVDLNDASEPRQMSSRTLGPTIGL
jgi:hypothetical protein